MDPQVLLLLIVFFFLLILHVPVAVCIAVATIVTILSLGDVPTGYIVSQKISTACYPVFCPVRSVDG